jgi:DNA invertase Pin-like site-specific DNA recombinase
MHAIKSGPVGIYARFSTDLQDERSIEDQVRRCRE